MQANITKLKTSRVAEYADTAYSGILQSAPTF